MMRRWGFALASLLLCAVSVAAPQGRRPPLPSDEAARRYGLVRRWYAHAPIDGVQEKVQSVTVVGNQVHLQTNASRIHVLHGETGRVLWSAQLGRRFPGQVGSAINSNSVFAINGSSLYRLSREDGATIWSIRLPQAANAAPAADDSHVLVSTADGRVYAYDVDTHAVHWFYQTNAPVSMPAVFVDGKIAVASEDGMLYIFPPNERNPLLRYRTDAPVSAPLAVWGRYVLLASEDYNVYAVDVRGRLGQETRWMYPAGAPIRDPVSVVDNEVVITPEDSGLHVLNADSGKRLWWYPRANQFMAASANRLYAADRYGQVVVLDRQSGRLFGTWDTHEFEFRVRNEANDRLYLATQRGLVVCMHETENQKPRVHEKVVPAPPAAPGGVRKNAAAGADALADPAR